MSTEYPDLLRREVASLTRFSAAPAVTIVKSDPLEILIALPTFISEDSKDISCGNSVRRK